jgi:hypothetical protein
MDIRQFLCTITLLALSGYGHAGQAEYDDCLLKHLKNAKHDVATHLIRQACYGNYYKPSFTSDKRRAYNDCLLDHLVGVESFDAVMEISAACDRKTR